MVEVEKAVAAAMVEDKPEEREEGEITSPLAASRADKKHPLEHAWTFWFDNPSGKTKQQQWGNSLRSVHTVSTVEDFWCLYNNVISPSRLINGADFHCFKEGIEPKWEDPKCAYGGKWTVSPPKGNKAALDQFWLHTLLALIGEQFEEGDEICGVVVNVRQRGDKLSLWTKTATNETAQVSIGKQWKDFLEVQEKIGYTFHEDAKKPQERARTRYSV